LLAGLAACAGDSIKTVSDTGAAADGGQPGVTASPAAREIAPGVLAFPPITADLPGEFAFRTVKGFYLTAIDGGGRTADPILITASTKAGPWEKFRLIVTYPDTPHDKSIQTAGGNYLTAMGGGGLTASVFHTDATQARDWERFRLLDLRDRNFAPSFYALYTIKGFYVTAVGGGGKYADAFHTDATEIQDWEKFRIVKCGDIGSGYAYGVMAANEEFLGHSLAGQPGSPQGNVSLGSAAGPPLKLVRQSDGSYAFQTSNGINYVTALGGGGQVSQYDDCGGRLFGACSEAWTTIFHTDATQIQDWEKFRIVEQGNCTYTIQTVKGFYVGIYKNSHGWGLTTDRSTISENEKFQLVMYGLASPAIIR
jgi:hypothetical protein